DYVPSRTAGCINADTTKLGYRRFHERPWENSFALSAGPRPTGRCYRPPAGAIDRVEAGCRWEMHGFGFSAIGRIRPDPRTRAAMAHMRAGPRATSVTRVRQICRA